jgi:hypothetical protein
MLCKNNWKYFSSPKKVDFTGYTTWKAEDHLYSFLSFILTQTQDLFPK